MTRERAKELLPIIQAYADGKDVQFKSTTDGEWYCDSKPDWTRGLIYRIKPEPRVFWIVINEFGGAALFCREDSAKHHASFKGSTIHRIEI